MDKRIFFFVILFLIAISVFSFRYTTSTTAYFVNTRQISSFVRIHYCFWEIVPRWNQLSYCSEKPDYNLSYAFSEIDSQYRFVLKWDSSEQEFEVYSPRAIDNPFDTFYPNETVFIFFENETTKKIEHDEPFFESIDFTLIKGWNAIPYVFLADLNVDSLANEMEDFRFILKWNKFEQKFDVYSPRAVENELEYIYVSEGIFIYSEKFQSYSFSEGDFR